MNLIQTAQFLMKKVAVGKSLYERMLLGFCMFANCLAFRVGLKRMCTDVLIDLVCNVALRKSSL